MARVAEYPCWCNAQALFNVPAGSDPVALDMGSMGKGQVWVNGHHAGRFWSYRAYSGSCRRCSYAGTYREDQCMSNCGDLTQRWYVYVETAVACNMGSAATCQACFLTESTHGIFFTLALQVPRAAVVAEAEREPAGGAGGVRRRRPRRRRPRDTEHMNKASDTHCV